MTFLFVAPIDWTPQLENGQHPPRWAHANNASSTTGIRRCVFMITPYLSDSYRMSAQHSRYFSARYPGVIRPPSIDRDVLFPWGESNP
jgi:hypothetical protein